MLWLFDKRREFIFQGYIPEFEAMNHEDLLDFQRHEEDENVTNRRKIDKINKRIGIKNQTRQLVDTIQPSRRGISHNSPIKINGEGAITYKVVQDYMASKMKVTYVEKDGAEDELRAIRSEIIITVDMLDSNGKVKCMVHQ